MIAQGRVTVNGKRVNEQGVRINPATDQVRVDGGLIVMDAPSPPVYIMLHKPVGCHSTVSDRHAAFTVMELIQELGTRVYPVGRLDALTSGLLLMTNDGEFANKLTHPRYHVPRTYRVRVRGFVTRETATRLAEGVELTDGMTLPAEVKFIDYDTATACTIIEMTIYEGRNRQVRRMFQAVGHPVKELSRIAFGHLLLRDLAAGTWRKLKPPEVASLLEEANTPSAERPGAPPTTTRKAPRLRS